MKQLLHAAIALGFAAAPAVAQAQSSTNHNQSNTAGQTSTQTNAASLGPVAQKLQQDLEQSGFKNVHVMPESFLVRANDKDGHPVMMIVNPDSLTAVTQLLNAHHIIVDGWSLGLFWQELLTLYSAFAAGQPARLPEPPIQYADFAVWQREHMRGERLEAQLAYWKKQLGGHSMLELPYDRIRPVVQTFEGRDLKQVFPGALRAALSANSAAGPPMNAAVRPSTSRHDDGFNAAS